MLVGGTSSPSRIFEWSRAPTTIPSFIGYQLREQTRNPYNDDSVNDVSQPSLRVIPVLHPTKVLLVDVDRTDEEHVLGVLPQRESKVAETGENHLTPLA